MKNYLFFCLGAIVGIAAFMLLTFQTSPLEDGAKYISRDAVSLYQIGLQRGEGEMKFQVEQALDDVTDAWKGVGGECEECAQEAIFLVGKHIFDE